MKSKIKKITVSLLMIVGILLQTISINGITAFAESIDSPDSSERLHGAGVPSELNNKFNTLRMSRALSEDIPTFFGISNDAIVNELSSHESDGFYIGTPYRGLYTNPDEANYLSPNGAPTSYGPGMNCTGFVATVMKRAGADISRVTNNSNGFGGAANAFNWRDVLIATTSHDSFGSISEMLASNTLRKGDIIFFDPDTTINNYDAHIGFFWGNTPSDNKFWHSYDPGGNMISAIKEKTPSKRIYVFKNKEPEGNIKIKKVDDLNKNIEGAEFKLTANGTTTTAKTDKNGELVTPNYTVGTVLNYEETKSVEGHYIDESTSKGTVTIKTGTNTINIINPRYANLTLIKKNDKGQNLEGTKFKLTYNGKDHEVNSDKNGQMIVKNLKANTKVDWEELATIKGHYIDPSNSKGLITVKSGENTINISNPTLNVSMDSLASNVDGAKFINPAKDQKLRDQVKIEATQAPENAKLRLTTDFVEFGTGKQLSKESFKQVNEFDAKQAKFVKNVDITLDATNMHGQKGVFTNVLEYFNPSTNAWEEVSRHDDVTNEDEAIQIVKPEIHTELFFYDQNHKEVKATDPLKEVKGYDRVFYKNFISGEKYTFDLSMMNRETEKEFTDPSGKPIKGTITIEAGKDGKVTSTVNGKEYYEGLAKEDKESADEETKDSATTDSSIVPKTVEKDSEQNEVVDPEQEQTDYTPIKDVELVTGSVDVPFTANLKEAASKVMVAYEQVTNNDTPVADHKNIKEEKQTGNVRNPHIGTSALVNGEKQVTTDGKVTLTDEIAYKDLSPNVEYEASLVWMDARTKQPVKVAGKELTSTIKFTPKESNGKVTVTIDDVAVQELFGKDSQFSLVAFEEVTTNGEEIANHKKIDDKGQTITIVKPLIPNVPTSTPNKVLPQTSGTLGNPIVLLIAALVIVAGAIFIFVMKKRDAQK